MHFILESSYSMNDCVIWQWGSNFIQVTFLLFTDTDSDRETNRGIIFIL